MYLKTIYYVFGFFLLTSLKGFLGMPYQLLTYWKKFGHYIYFYCGSKIVVVCSVLSNVLWMFLMTEAKEFPLLLISKNLQEINANKSFMGNKCNMFSKGDIWVQADLKMWRKCEIIVQCVQCRECSVHSLVMCQQTWHTAAHVTVSRQRASFNTHLAFCISFEGQKQHTEKAKLLLATAAMVILKRFH